MPLPPTELPANVVEALRRGNKSEAIRLMREFQQGLKTAKAQVGALRKPHAPHTAYTARRPGLSPGEVPPSGGAGWWLAALAAGAIVSWYLLASPEARAHDASPAANRVEISPRLVTSGQPDADALGRLRAQGFEAVIYLAPASVPDAVRDEQLIVTRQGIAFINIPIRFDQPTEADFETFAAVLGALGNRKVLVHCQVNLRASSMVFLYRAIKLKEDPRAAYEAVTRVWAPDAAWRRLIEQQLRKHQVAFELL